MFPAMAVLVLGTLMGSPPGTLAARIAPGWVSAVVDLVSGVTNACAAVEDKDGDGVPDSKDTCPDAYNAYNENDLLDRQFRDTDGDGIMDACDNCPHVYNPKQQDKDDNRIGDPCEEYRLSVESPTSLKPSTEGVPYSTRTAAHTIRGAPHWEEFCVWNSSRKAITVIRPDCFNITTRWRRSSDLSPVVPRDLHGNAYGVPEDLEILEPGRKACVQCDLSETVAPENLSAGDYLVDHTYTNWVQDRHYNFKKKSCTLQGEKCYPEIWIGWMIGGSPRTITVGPEKPVRRLQARCSFNPEVWMADWAGDDSSQLITATLTVVDEEGQIVPKGLDGLDPSSVVMNGHTVPVSISLDDAGTTLTLRFNSREAVSSLRTPVVAGRFFQTVQGKVKAGIFTAQGPIVLHDASNVAVDVKKDREYPEGKPQP